MEKKVLLMDDKITIGQCFNLAHNQVMAEVDLSKKDMPLDIFYKLLKERTKDLFKAKKDVTDEIANEYGRGVQQ